MIDKKHYFYTKRPWLARSSFIVVGCVFMYYFLHLLSLDTVSVMRGSAEFESGTFGAYMSLSVPLLIALAFYWLGIFGTKSVSK